jgi:cytochrome c oxidase subunit 2
VIAVLVLGAAFHFGQSWFPTAVNASAQTFDAAWKLNLLMLGVAFVVVHAVLAGLIWRRRSPGSHDQPSLRSEFYWVGAALFLFVGLAVASTRHWEADKPIGPASAPLRIEVTGQQFRWYFRYPGEDHRFGRTNLALADASEGNPLGLDHNDPDGKDDRVSAELVIPAAQEVEVDLRSMDVVHSFFIPQLRFKQDAVPGMQIPAHFRFDQPGEYEIACAELCGLGHHQMNAKVKVLPREKYREWEARR